MNTPAARATTNFAGPLVLRKKDAAAMVGISVATLDRLRVANTFVKPVQLGQQAIGFLRSDLEEWLSNQPYLARFDLSYAL